MKCKKTLTSYNKVHFNKCNKTSMSSNAACSNELQQHFDLQCQYHVPLWQSVDTT
jgi:hypothetical protein